MPPPRRRRAAGDGSDGIDHALLHASEFLTARETLLHHWLGLVVGARADEVECTAMLMLRRTPDDAQVLLVRACASDVLGDHQVARELFRRAEAMIGRSGDDDEPAVLQIARLFIADERAEVADASAKVQQMLLDADSTDLGDRAALNYLLGWTEIRHRGNPMVLLEYFSAAARRRRARAIESWRSARWGISPSGRPGPVISSRPDGRSSPFVGRRMSVFPGAPTPGAVLPRPRDTSRTGRVSSTKRSASSEP